MLMTTQSHIYFEYIKDYMTDERHISYGIIKSRKMRILLVIGLFAGWCSGAQVNLQVGAPPMTIQSSRYPSSSPPPTAESITVIAPPGSTVLLTCQDVRANDYERPAAPGQCGNFALRLSDGRTAVDLCGSHSGYEYESSMNTLSMDLRAFGRMGEAAFRCYAQARSGGGGGGAPGGGAGGGIGGGSQSPFFSRESTKLQSREHGVTPGRRGTTCKCGWANKGSYQRIVGGAEARANSYPFATAIHDKRSGQQFCGGTILSKTCILTAAHCTDPVIKNRGSIYVQVGIHNVNAPSQHTQKIDVARIVQHEGYDAQVFRNDISLLMLAREIQFTDYVGPACISPSQNNLEKQYVKIVGWGMIQHQGAQSPVLKELNIRVVPHHMCRRTYNEIAQGRQICTHSYRQGACMGDSGGPVVWVDPDTNRYTIVGLVSFGRICASEDPSVHTDVSGYYSWIVSKISASSTCSKN